MWPWLTMSFPVAGRSKWPARESRCDCLRADFWSGVSCLAQSESVLFACNLGGLGRRPRFFAFGSFFATGASHRTAQKVGLLIGFTETLTLTAARLALAAAVSRLRLSVRAGAGLTPTFAPFGTTFSPWRRFGVRECGLWVTRLHQTGGIFATAFIKGLVTRLVA